MQERFPAHEVELADVVFDAGDGGERREVPFVRVQVKEAGFGDWGEVDAPTAAEVAVVRHVHVDARLPVEARKAIYEREFVWNEAPRGGWSLVPRGHIMKAHRERGEQLLKSMGSISREDAETS